MASADICSGCYHVVAITVEEEEYCLLWLRADGAALCHFLSPIPKARIRVQDLEAKENGGQARDIRLSPRHPEAGTRTLL